LAMPAGIETLWRTVRSVSAMGLRYTILHHSAPDGRAARLWGWSAPRANHHAPPCLLEIRGSLKHNSLLALHQEAACGTLVAGLDLNQRPLGYEFVQPSHITDTYEPDVQIVASRGRKCNPGATGSGQPKEVFGLDFSGRALSRTGQETASRMALASRRSDVSNPSVNQP
jgi:hypothetical protein